MNEFIVTRQQYCHSGELVVEIAQGGRDYCNADALVERYPGEFEVYDSLVEAVEIAISIAEAWKWDTDKPVLIALGCTHGMTIPFEGQPAGEEAYAALREQAKQHDESLPRCSICGDILKEEYFSHDFSDDKFCSEYCCDKAAADFAEEEEEDDDGEED